MSINFNWVPDVLAQGEPKDGPPGQDSGCRIFPTGDFKHLWYGLHDHAIRFCGGNFQSHKSFEWNVKSQNEGGSKVA